jgi:DNA-binding NtrC family response regulator
VLFLDEIVELTPPAQAKILRVLEEREFRRLGGTKSLKANVRVIVATNRNLHNAVSRGAFREDLYYRVNVFEIRIPPLRERREDILLFARRFLHDFGNINGLRAIDLTPEAADALLAHTWPGNVRELRNVIERATIVCDGGVIRASDLADGVDAADFGRVMQRVHHDAALLRPHGDEVLPAVKCELPDPDLALHPFVHHRERVARHFSVRRQVARPVDVHRIDGGIIGELHEIDHPRRLGADFVEVLL